MDKKSGFQTVYDTAEAGAIAFQSREEVAPQIDALLETLRELQQEYKQDTQIAEALHEIEMKLQALRMSSEPLEAIQEKLRSLTEVPLGPEKKINLAAFRRKTASAPIANEAEYLAHVKRLVRNTLGNLSQLLINAPDDSILQRFLKELQELQLDGDYKSVKHQMEKFGKSPQLWHYNEKKKDFLLEWLKPFQGDLGKPLDKMTAEELQEALKKVEKLRETKLETMTNLTQEKERGPWREYNKDMHAVMNGKNKDFWGGAETRDEFIRLMTKIISRFAYNLEDRFLVFRTKDGGFSYLIGFADDAFSGAVAMEGGKLALYPHLKAFLHSGDTKFHEIEQKDYAGDSSAYFRALKTAVVPFLTSISVMAEFELSKQIKESFDMWT